MRVLGLSGSLRRDSYNRRLLAAAARCLPPGVELEEWRGLERIPPYSADLDVDPAPVAVAELRAALAGADAVLIATPEYNHSIPGQLKNALDWASRPFQHNALRAKPVAVIGASTGLFGAVWAQAEVRKVLAAIGAHPIDEELPVAQAHEAFEADGSLRDPSLETALADILWQLLEAAGAPGPEAWGPALATATARLQ
jgi:chromate reductase, NAD(P)H dehydrogenase (quinone)